MSADSVGDASDTATFNLGRLLDLAVDSAGSNFERGRALESFAAKVFGSVPGVFVHASNSVDVFSCQELDVVLENRGHSEGLFGFDLTLMVECKNWSVPVGAIEVAWFDTKLRMRGLRTGLLLALNGITGNRHSLTAGHAIVAAALAERRRIIVLEPHELSGLSDGAAVANLCRQRLTELHMTRGLPHLAKDPR